MSIAWRDKYRSPRWPSHSKSVVVSLMLAACAGSELNSKNDVSSGADDDSVASAGTVPELQPAEMNRPTATGSPAEMKIPAENKPSAEVKISADSDSSTETGKVEVETPPFVDGSESDAGAGEKSTVVPDAMAVAPPEEETSLSPQEATMVAGVLDGYRLELPCVPQPEGLRATGGCAVLPEHDRQVHVLTLGGDPSLLYEVELRVRGVVELVMYLRGERVNPRIVRGGAVGQQAFTTSSFALSVSSPVANYFLNHRDGGAIFGAIDSAFVFVANGNSTITLEVNPPPFVPDGSQRNNRDGATVKGDDLGPQPYHGQFLQLDLLSVAEARGVTQEVP